jgi:plasmid maintenance system antidote protein VapI
MTQPLQISPDTAIKLSKQLGVPIEHLMHMPKHILLQRLTELAKAEAEANKPSESTPGSEESSS